MATICIRFRPHFLHHDGLQCGYCTPGQIMVPQRR